MEKIKKLTVKYNGNIVGCLAEIDENRIAFQYDEDWERNRFSISPFSLPLSDEIYISRKEHFEGLFGVFYDSLPETGANCLSRGCLQKRVSITSDCLH